MDILPIFVCVSASLAVIFEIFNKNYSAASWAFCAAIWSGVAIS